MSNYKDKISSDGGINRDISVEILQAGDYPDALDISFLGDGVNASKSKTPKLGNTFAYDRGSVSAQNKKYRLYIDMSGSGTLSYTVSFYKTDTTTLLFSASFSNTTLAAADTAISNAAAAAGYGINIVNNGVFLLIEFAPMSGGVQTNYYDYFINDTGTDELEDLYVYQEAIDLTLVGENRAIGSFDLLGDLFIWSTSQTELPSDLGVTITNVSNTSNIIITFSSAHGLNTGERILVQGVEGNTAANGYWIVVNISANVIQLALSSGNGVWVASTGSITINPSGIGEIGVAQKIQSTQNWSYTRLLRSKEWNWNTKKQFDTYCEETATRKNLYGTNDYTPPMCFYYQTAYSTDGALTFNGGLYDYGTVFDETRLFLSVLNTQIEFTEQLQAGGALTAGNKRYAVRALTETATATDWSDVTNPVNVYSAAISGNVEKIVGDAAAALTSKVNVLTITNIQSDIFKYIEVACIEYSGLAVSGYIINRYSITGSEMVINHTGNETAIQLDINEIQTFSIPISTAKNIRAIDNRLILSNITTVSDEDLSAVARQIQHSVVRSSLNSVYINQANGVSYGEYQDPINVNTKVGYMINDVYRFSIKFRYRIGGAWTKNYWVDDIIINNSATNTANPFGDNRRIAGLPNLMLTTGFDTYSPYIEFTNVDFNYITQSGDRLGYVFDAISFERAECVPEILFTGLARMGVIENYPPYGIRSPRPNISPSSFIDYSTLPLLPPPTGGSSPYYTLERKYMTIYSPDALFANLVISREAGDKLYNYGSQAINFSAMSISFVPEGFLEFLGFYSSTPNTFAPTLHDVDDAKDIFYGEQISLNSNDFLNSSPFFVYNTPTPVDLQYTKGIAVSTSSDLQSVGIGLTDTGYYYVQYYRQKLDKYGDIAQTEYISCGNTYSVDGSLITTVFDVLGGDTFTQKTYLKTSTVVSTGTTAGALNDGIGFVSQNRVNSQMRQRSNQSTEKVFPADTTGLTIIDRINDWLTNGYELEKISYDSGYTIQNGIDIHTSYDPDLIDNNNQPTRIRWSPVKPQNAIADLYRVFLPFDFHDLDNSFGEITHHENVNGELFTLQPKKWQRQFFNTRGTLDVRGISDVLIGDGSVMSRDGITISNFGCSNKWSVIKGRSQGGNDTIYWIDIINKQAIRFGADGTVGISTIRGLLSYLANNLTWCIANDTPADGEGICGVWDMRFHEAIWTVRAVRPHKERLTDDDPIGTPQTYDSGTTYSAGNVVYYEGGAQDFNQVQVFYRSLVSQNLNHIPTDTAYWEIIPLTDNEYYNQFSLCFNELKNKFTSFYTPTPKIYMQWMSGYLTPRPVSTQSRDYEANRGQYSIWYNQGTSQQESEPFIEMVYNKDDMMPKMFYAYLVDSSIIPYKIDFLTNQHTSTSLSADFKDMIGKYGTAIKDDTTIVTPIGYSKLYGSYIICRFYFETGVYSKLDDAVIKFTSVNPNYTR